MISSKPIELLKQDVLDVEQVVQRITSGFEKKQFFTSLSAIFAGQGSGRSSMLNFCSSFASENHSAGSRIITWIKPFEAWKMTSMGNLLVALLWHIHRNLPDHVARDEKVLYKLGRISVAIAAISGTAAQLQGFTGDTNFLELISKTLPPDRKSPVSSIFSACEQLESLSDEFCELGELICQINKCDSILVPVDDLDRCVPAQAIPLLVSLKTLASNRYFSFLVTVDKNVLTRFIKNVYHDVFNDEQASSFIYKIFDDWVTLPAPHLNKMLEKISFPNKDAGVAFVNYALEAGIYTMAASPASIMRACRRFEIFINDNLKRSDASPAEYLGWFGWFLVGAENPEVITRLSNIPDLPDLLNSLRSNSSEKIPRTPKKESKDGPIRISFDMGIPTTKAAVTAKDPAVHPAARIFLSEPESAIICFVEATKSRISEDNLAWSFREVLPYI